MLYFSSLLFDTVDTARVSRKELVSNQKAGEQYLENFKRAQTVHHARGRIVGCARVGKAMLHKLLLGRIQIGQRARLMLTGIPGAEKINLLNGLLVSSEGETKKMKYTEGLEVHEEQKLFEETKSLRDYNIYSRSLEPFELWPYKVNSNDRLINMDPLELAIEQELMMPFDCWIPCFYFGSPLNDQWKDSISEIPKFFVEQYKPKDIKVLIFKNLIQLEVHITFSENGTHGTFPLFMISDTVFDLNEHILFCNTDLHISDFKYSESRIGHFYSNPTPESESVKNNKNLLSCFGLQPHHLINDTGPSLKNGIACANETEIVDLVRCEPSVCIGLQKINQEKDDRKISDLQKCDTRLCMESRLHQQWHTFNLNLLMELTTKFLLMYFFISIIGSKCFPIQLISAQHCEISNISMKIVESCPFNLESWKQRSKLKNCSSLYKHSTCSWPENYVYHCVIDHFMSVKMEMCAVEAYINLGYCAEYNTKGELIQANYEAKCHHCPGRYLSSTAYKYQECYNMTQKPEITTLEHLGTSEDKTTTFTSINRTTQQNDRERNSFNGIGVTLGTILAVLFISVIIIILRCYPKYKENRSKKNLSMSSRMEFPTFPLSLTKTSSALTEKCANFESEENEKRIHGSENRKCSCYSLSNETKNRESVIIVESQTLDEYNVSPSGHSRRYDEEEKSTDTNTCKVVHKGFSRTFDSDNIKYMDEDVEDIEEPDISVRDKQPLLADYSGDGYVTLKEKAKERLENALFNFTIYMEKDDECLETFLKNDHYKLLMENINSYSKTEVTAKEIPLLSNYAELVESRFKDIRIE